MCLMLQKTVPIMNYVQVSEGIAVELLWHCLVSVCLEGFLKRFWITKLCNRQFFNLQME